MLDREAGTRADKRLANRLRAARLRFADACIEDIDFAAEPGLDRRTILELADGAWLKAHENLIITGQTGTGKTWLGCAFGHQAARLDHSVLHVRMPRLFEDLAMARLDGRLPRLVDKLARVQLLVLDDWGTHGLSDRQRLDLVEICEERYRRKSTLISAQVPVAKWLDLIGEPTRQRCPGLSETGVRDLAKRLSRITEIRKQRQRHPGPAQIPMDQRPIQPRPPIGRNIARRRK